MKTAMPTMLNFLFEPPWCMSFFCAVENNFLSSSLALATSISMFYWTLLTLSSYCIWSGGRFSDGWGSCDRRDKRFNKPNHDIPSTAETRAKNKACQVWKTSALLHLLSHLNVAKLLILRCNKLQRVSRWSISNRPRNLWALNLMSWINIVFKYMGLMCVYNQIIIMR